VKLDDTSVSGISSGAYMAVQFAVAESSLVQGVGALAGGPYYCAQDDVNLATGRCMVGPAPSIDTLTSAAHRWAAGGEIDTLSNLARQKVWLFNGYDDGVVKRPVTDALYAFYKTYDDEGNMYYKDDIGAAHAQVTDSFGQTCNVTGGDFINNCGYDAAGLILQHIYGSLNPPNTGTLSGSIVAFDQSAFRQGSTINTVSMASTAYAYVPASCASQQPCRVHVAFHGCLQNADTVGDAYYTHAGYNQWADTNDIIVLYPQTAASTIPFNPNGCWDWWGYSSPDYAKRKAPQISVVAAELNRLAGKYTGWSDSAAGPFGPPKNFAADNGSASRIALRWSPVSGSVGYDVYRATCSACSFSRVNAAAIHGMSYVDRNLLPETSYFYKVRAVSAHGTESTDSAVASRKTDGAAPFCDPYYRSVYQQWQEGRTYTFLSATYAKGSNAYVGLIGPGSLTTQALLTQSAPDSGYFLVGKPCP
jgi:poly(3-hydroxybutyrate) depolymerase